MEYITLVLSIIGSVGTIISSLYLCLNRRVKLDAKITGCNLNKRSLLLYISFTNKSSIPVGITDTVLKYSNKTFFAFKNPIVVFRSTYKVNKVPVNYKEDYNEPFPIQLPAYGGVAGYVYFAFPQGHDLNASTPLTLEFPTNRHKIIRMKLQLSEVDLLNPENPLL